MNLPTTGPFVLLSRATARRFLPRAGFRMPGLWQTGSGKVPFENHPPVDLDQRFRLLSDGTAVRLRQRRVRRRDGPLFEFSSFVEVQCLEVTIDSSTNPAVWLLRLLSSPRLAIGNRG